MVNEFIVEHRIRNSDILTLEKENSCINILKVFDEIIPDFSCQLNENGLSLQKMTEEELRTRIKSVSRLIDKNSRNQLSRLVAAKLTVKKRDYLNRVDSSDLKKYYNC